MPAGHDNPPGGCHLHDASGSARALFGRRDAKLLDYGDESYSIALRTRGKD